MNKPDLHLHTTVSDGTDTPEELLDHVREAGLDLFAVTDHDAVKGCMILRNILRADDPAFVTGAEFSCKDEEGKYHILGYGYDPDGASMQSLVGYGHELRMKKFAARLAFLKEKFGIRLPEDETARLYALDNPGKPHLANLLVKYGFAKSKEDAIDNYINRLRMKSGYVRPEEAIRGILGSGGIPVLAHPSYGSGDDVIVGEAMENRVRRLTRYGLEGLEAFYGGFSPKLREENLSLAEKYGLYVTAGSDYHGANKMVRIGDTGFDPDGPVPEGLRRFGKDVRVCAPVNAQQRKTTCQKNESKNRS